MRQADPEPSGAGGPNICQAHATPNIADRERASPISPCAHNETRPHRGSRRLLKTDSTTGPGPGAYIWLPVSTAKVEGALLSRNNHLHKLLQSSFGPLSYALIGPSLQHYPRLGPPVASACASYFNNKLDVTLPVH
jgi:hypothetical protein